ncbi:helix-turn-helix domain-containing protein [Runella sp. CRIBMP]|uniref:helix-turn-helix domain-containing protein n=1 Tax=Runella sp. CRIBMP TaxID=2683261 RepID=UPI001411D967|nr:AraC family transcriptional regulator [Runella sp. CRIBMP]NBB19197.1 helix-turn-helix domain-containing protein [Runella sp. CRIBMP]
MKPQLEKLSIEGSLSYLARGFNMAFFDAPWHYHPEYELTYIVKSHGQRFVGDHIGPFYEGDLVLLGSNLPHFWRNDDAFYQSNPALWAESVVIQFPQSLVYDFIEKVPEFTSIQELMKRSARGIKFSNESTQRIEKDILQLPYLPEGVRFISFLGILLALTKDKSAEALASSAYQITPDDADTERMKRIIEFTLRHFQEEIRLEIVAETAHMTVPAFCRYFKKRTQKTYVEFLNNFRLSHARKLLSNSDLSVAQVGLECGFRNLSNFHQIFKRHTGLSPLQYKTEQKKRIR